MEIYFTLWPDLTQDLRLLTGEYILLRWCLLFLICIILGTYRYQRKNLQKVQSLQQPYSSFTAYTQAIYHQTPEQLSSYDYIHSALAYLEHTHSGTPYSSLEELLSFTSIAAHDQKKIITYIYQDQGNAKDIQQLLTSIL